MRKHTGVWYSKRAGQATQPGRDAAVSVQEGLCIEAFQEIFKGPKTYHFVSWVVTGDSPTATTVLKEVSANTEMLQSSGKQLPQEDGVGIFTDGMTDLSFIASVAGGQFPVPDA
eukprot:1504787-Rhodomonas_salina.1